MSLSANLKSSPLFHDLLEEEIEMFLKGQKLYTWHPGDYAIKGGNPIEAFYIIIEGQADLYYNSWDREFLMQELKRWDHFGEVLFSNDQVHPYSVCAKTEITCLRIDFPVFKSIFQKNPQVYALFINNLLRIELNLKKQALGLVGRIRDQQPSIQIGLPLYNRRKKITASEREAAKEIKIEKKVS